MLVRDRILFTEGLVPERNWLNDRNFTIEEDCVHTMSTISRLGNKTLFLFSTNPSVKSERPVYNYGIQNGTAFKCFYARILSGAYIT